MSTSMKYRPDIDGLRAIAVLAVVLHHLLPSTVPGGYVGVDIFFVISGFLITGIISREVSEGHFSFINFYERRVRRLFPTLFVMLAVVLVVGYFLLLPSDYRSTLRAALGTIFFSSNAVFWKSMVEGYFADDAKLNPLLHTWSLSVEEQFYLFFPWLLLLCYRFCRRHVALVLLASGAVSLILASTWVKSHAVATFFLSPFRAWELLAGGLLALNACPSLRSRALREGTAAMALVAIGFAIFWFDTRTGVPGYTALLPVLGAAALLHVGTCGGSAVSRLLQLKPVVYIGLISYSVYLWHWPLIVLTRFGIGMDPLYPYVPALLVGSLVLGSLSYHFIEQPFRSRNRFTRRGIFGLGLAAACGLVLTCAIGLRSRGNESRYSAELLVLDMARYPAIPYRECSGRKEGCLIGAAGVVPSMLLWGDSHLLAWGPVFDSFLSASGGSALFKPGSACAPLIGAGTLNDEGCHTANVEAIEYLTTHPAVRTVVMAAYWKKYFEGELPSNIHDSGRTADQRVAESLRETIWWLTSHGKEVYLIGPVPVYDRDVPLALALQQHSRGGFLQTLNMHRGKQSAFYHAVDGLKNPGLHLVDPASWMCKPECIVQNNGVPLYRDSHHLSVAGAMFAIEPLTGALRGIETPGNVASDVTFTAKRATN